MLADVLVENATLKAQLMNEVGEHCTGEGVGQGGGARGVRQGDGGGRDRCAVWLAW